MYCTEPKGEDRELYQCLLDLSFRVFFLSFFYFWYITYSPCYIWEFYFISRLLISIDSRHLLILGSLNTVHSAISIYHPI